MNAWAVRLYDAEDRLLVETTVSADTCRQALDAALAVRLANAGTIGEAELQRLTRRLIAARLGAPA